MCCSKMLSCNGKNAVKLCSFSKGLFMFQERHNIPCHIDSVSCGEECEKPLSCGKHKCIKGCHKVSEHLLVCVCTVY